MSIASFGLKIAKPALLAGYREYRHELARRRVEPVGTLTDLGDVRRVLDEALRVLARNSDSMIEAGKDWLRAQISLPGVFEHETARRWIASEVAQQALRGAVIAVIRGDDDAPFAAEAAAHYDLFLDDALAETAPDAGTVYIEALDFILRSLQRAMTSGESVIAAKIDGLTDTLHRTLPADTGEYVDAHVEELVRCFRHRRFFRSSNATERAKTLAAQLTTGNLRGASPRVRARGLAWCARVNAFEETSLAAGWLDAAAALNPDGEDVLVARALIAAGMQGWQAGITMLDVERVPAQATAALMILRWGLGTEACRERAAAAGIDAAAVDSDGRYVLVTAWLEVGQWPTALEAVEALDPADFAETPALLWLAATVLVASDLRDDLRPAVLQDTPTNPAHFPLSHDEVALDRRRRARALMLRVTARCRELELPYVARAAERYALWLDLRDPARHDEALGVLRERLANGHWEFDYLSMALSFGLPVDRAKSEAAIDQRLALGADPTPEIINAIVALLIDHAVHGEAALAADLLLRHQGVLAAYLDPDSLAGLQVRILSEAGRHVEAQAVLAAHEPSKLSAVSRAVLTSRLAGDGSTSSIEALEAAYREDPQTDTLIALLRAYEQQGVGMRYVELAHELLGSLPDLGFANDIVSALRRAGLEEAALGIINLLGDVVLGSTPMLSHAAYLNFRRGRLIEADRALALLEGQRDASDDRSLRFNLLAANGDWEGIDAFLEAQWQRHADRGGLELIQLANLAAQVRSKRKRVEDFIKAAVTADPDDANVLLGAYMAATSAGIEDTLSEAFGWMARAEELSGPDGPVRRAPIQDLLAEQPAWDERVAEASKALAAGTGPIDLIARMVRRSWLDFHLAPLVTNPGESDARDRMLVAPFSGWRRLDENDTLAARSISLDRTALVTLALTGLLREVVAAFDRVYVMHDSLSDLFIQRSRLTFHQPSKVAFARHLVRLVTDGRVRAFAPQSIADLGLVADVGQSRAALLADAASQRDGQHLVVHPFPMHRPGSFLDEPVPLERYHAHLCSCAAIIDALVRDGRLRQSEADGAHRYLAAHEQRWPEEPTVEKGATLYLTDLAVSYLRYVGVLDRLADAGMTVIVSGSELDKARALLAIDARSFEVDLVIDQARAAIADGLAAGKVVFDAAPGAGDEEAAETEAWASLAARAAILVCDDRFLNRYANFDHAAGRTRILSSLDLLELFSRDGRLSRARMLEARSQLRQAGAVFVPVDRAELADMMASTVCAPADPAQEGSAPPLRETAELRALRENIWLVQARGWFDPLFDAAWLLNLDQCLADVIAEQWQPGVDDNLARARSNWLVALLDTRDWADNLEGHDREDLAERGIVLDHAKLVLAADAVPGSERARYEAWLEVEAIAPLWRRQPQLRALALNHLRGLITAGSRDAAKKHPAVTQRALARLSFDRLPAFLQSDLLEEQRFRDLVGYDLMATLTIGDTSFSRQMVLTAVAAIYAAPGTAQNIDDIDDAGWQLSTNAADPLWPLRFMRGAKRWQVRGIVGLQPTGPARQAFLDVLTSTYGVAPAVLAPWHDVLADRQLDADEIEAIDAALRDLPPVGESLIRDSLGVNSIAASELVPRDSGYYEHLVGASDAATLKDYAATPDRLVHLSWVPDDPGARASWALLLASQPWVLAGQFGFLSSEDLRGLGRWALESGDVLSKIGFAEIALPLAHTDPALEEIVIALSRQIEALEPDDKAGPLHLLSSLVMFVDGELSARRVLPGWPPFRRRMAAFAQAALIMRVVEGNIETGRFADFCAQQGGWRFAVQSLVDLQREPRWRPDYVSPDQLRYEFIGRLVNAAAGLSEEQSTARLRARFTAKRGSLRRRLVYPMAFWPGPLEGGIDLDLPLADSDLSGPIAEALAVDPPDATMFDRLITIGGLLRLPTELTDQAIDRLRAVGLQALAPLPPQRVDTYLLGLAHVAAGSRLSALADVVRMLARIQRANVGVRAQDDMQIGLYLAAASGDPAEWRRSIGHWALELARQVKDRYQAELLLGWIDALSDVDPALRAWIGRARATLNLWLGS